LAPLASAEITGPAYEPARYWRGPAWINTSWLVWRGLLRHARWSEAEQLRVGMLEAVRRAGFREYFDARTGEGRGADNFSWTAALALDLLAHRPAIDLTTSQLSLPAEPADHPRLGQDAAFSG
jgi:glycogen debranching enzyme